MILDSKPFVNLFDRENYYKWGDKMAKDFGSEVRWMGAAAGTVNILSYTLTEPASWVGSSNEEINNFIVVGNKVILDDMMPSNVA